MHSQSRQTRIANGEGTAIIRALGMALALVLFVSAYAALLGAVA